MRHRSLPLFTLLIFFFCTNSLFAKSYKADFNIPDFYRENGSEIYFYDDGSYVSCMPKDYETTAPDTGIVFYPGGLVDYHAYLPLVTELSKKGIACFIAKMPLNFAFMDMDAAEKFLNMHPEITKWYLAGHSLGGAMAASYISKHPEDYKGLILLAAYSTHNLSNKNLNIISIRGSNDGVIKLNLYEKEKENLPEIGNGFTEIIIHGGNHAQFGNYGEQKGDNQAEISAKEQQKITATEILHWMGIE